MAGGDPYDVAGELIRFGKVETVDLAHGRITVRVGEIVSGPIRWLQGAAGDTQIWLRPKVGEQVTLLAPHGDIEAALALRGMVSDAHPPLGDPDREVIAFADGAAIAYDPIAHALTAILPTGATARIEADGGLLLKGDVRIEGKLQVTEDVTLDAKLTAQGEIQSGAIKLTQHKHAGVQSGGAKTAIPE